MGLDNFFHDRITNEDTFNYTLPEILQERAKRTPDQTAYIFLKDGDDDEEMITYKELDRAARKIAYHVRLTGAAGDRALMLFPPGLEFIKALFGCFYAGVIAVPAYAPRKNRSLDRIKMLVVDSGSTLVLSNADISQAIERSFSDLDELKQMKWLIMEDIATDGNIDTGAGVLSQPGEVALLQYTSGSTGQPKGVMVTHRNIMRNCDFIRSSFGFSQQSIGVSWLPTFHDMGLVGQIFQPVFTGFTSVLMPPVTFLQKPIRWMRAFSKYRGTMGGAPNFAFDLLADSTTPEEREGLDLSSIKTIYCGAEPIRKSTFDRFTDVYKAYGLTPEMLYPCYGMAETTLITSGPPALRGPVYLCVSGNALEKNRIEQVATDHPDARYLTGVGFPWLDTRVRIIDPETLIQCTDEKVGEVWVTGSSVTYGYWNNPEITTAVFQSKLNDEPDTIWLRTGDLGFYHNGELYITGRLKDVIIIHGRNYYPQDIEFHTENCHPALQSNASAAFSFDVDNEEKLVIVAEVQRSFIRDLDVNSVCDAIREQISEEFELEVYAIQLLRTASILKTSSGKIQRKACRDGFLSKTLLVVGESINESASEVTKSGNEKPDITSLQAWLIAWIHIHLKIPFERIDQSKSISVYGLNSMKAVQLQQDVLDRYNVNVPPYVFFDKITLKELCERAFEKIGESN